MRRTLKGEPLVSPEEVFSIERSLPHDHVLALLGTIKKLRLDRLIAANHSRNRDLVVAIVAARILHPCSTLALAWAVAEDIASTSLGESLKLGQPSEEDLYLAMDSLLGRQTRIEQQLAARPTLRSTLLCSTT